jgi:polyisoprenoid-binding protein YceI
MGISTVRGTFTKLGGTVSYDPSDLSKTIVDVTIDASSVDSRVEMRDNDLRGEHFFDVQKYPTITFKAQGAEAAGPGKLTIPGDLTIHGVTKRVVLNVEGPSEPMKDPKGNTHVGASATTTIKRSDFAMTQMQGMVGDEVNLTIDVELINGPAGSGGPPPAPKK